MLISDFQRKIPFKFFCEIELIVRSLVKKLKNATNQHPYLAPIFLKSLGKGMFVSKILSENAFLWESVFFMQIN